MSGKPEFEPLHYIRPYGPDDYDQVRAILQTTGSFSAADHAAESFDQTREDYGTNSTLVYANHDQDTGNTALVGVVRLLSVESDNSKAVIGDLAVLPEQQPRGTGIQLLRAISNVARKRSPNCRPELVPELPASEAAGLRIADMATVADVFTRPTLEELSANQQQLKSAACRAADEIYTTLLEWDSTGLFSQWTDIINDWARSKPDTPYSQMTLDAVTDNKTGAGIGDMYVGHPHRESRNGRRLSTLLWCAVQPTNEAYQVLRLVESRGRRSFDMDFFTVDGHYIVHDKENEELYSLRINGKKEELEEKVTAHAITGRKGLNLCKELVMGTYVLDELHQHDLRWLGVNGYPWVT